MNSHIQVRIRFIFRFTWTKKHFQVTWCRKSIIKHTTNVQYAELGKHQRWNLNQGKVDNKNNENGMFKFLLQTINKAMEKKKNMVLTDNNLPELGRNVSPGGFLYFHFCDCTDLNKIITTSTLCVTQKTQRVVFSTCGFRNQHLTWT